MTRFACLLAVVAFVAGGSLSCSSSSDSSGSTTEQTAQGTTAKTQSTAAPPPPPTRPPSAAKRKRVYAELARLRDRGVTGPAVYRRVARKEGIGVDSVLLIEREGSLRRWKLPAAHGTIGWNQLIDTDKDAVPDTAFHTVMAGAEAVRNDPTSTKDELIEQRDLLRRVNRGAA